MSSFFIGECATADSAQLLALRFTGETLIAGTVQGQTPLLVDWRGNLLRLPSGPISLPRDLAQALHGGPRVIGGVYFHSDAGLFDYAVPID